MSRRKMYMNMSGLLKGPAVRLVCEEPAMRGLGRSFVSICRFGGGQMT
jgi:hypothetical protein